MRWTKVAWMGCLAPMLGGCLGVYHPHRDHVADAIVATTEQGIDREIHKQAREAWLAVRCEFPRKAFTPEFRDGFIDGYTDYLDRGGDAQPPAVPPLRYTQNKKYFTPEGHALVRDYFLGFKYGADVAVATGQRQFLTVPVLIPDRGEPLPVVSAASVPTIPALSGRDRPVPPLPAAPNALPSPRPMSMLPAPRKLPKGDSATNASTMPSLDPEVSKFGPVPPLPKYPVPDVPTIPSLPSIPMLPGSESGLAPSGGVKLPEPPSEVPSLPPHVPTPPIMDEFPPLPANHTAPPPLPANHSDPVK